MMFRSYIALILLSSLISVRGQSLAWPEVYMTIDSHDGTVLLDGKPLAFAEPMQAHGKTISTSASGFATLVFSTGLVIYCGPSSQLKVESAVQIEYVDTFAGGDVESAQSAIEIELVEGRFGFVQPEPYPTSTLALDTRYGLIQGDAAHFAVVLNRDTPTATALKGSLYYQAEGYPRRFIAEGEALKLSEASLDNTPSALTNLRASGKLRYEPLMAPALKAARRNLILASESGPVFRQAMQLNDLSGAAFNDYRLAH